MNPRPHDEKWRTRTRRALERYFDKRSAPRLILSVLLILTGTAGLLISILLLHAGLEAMSIRYPIAVLAGYGVFLLLLRFWVEFERARFNPESGEIDADLEMTEPNVFFWRWSGCFSLPFSPPPRSSPKSSSTPLSSRFFTATCGSRPRSIGSERPYGRRGGRRS
ncbi:hypothetical protein BH18VER2_BH18VER2_10440 [soil metagenome]